MSRETAFFSLENVIAFLFVGFLFGKLNMNNYTKRMILHCFQVNCYLFLYPSTIENDLSIYSCMHRCSRIHVAFRLRHILPTKGSNELSEVQQHIVISPTSCLHDLSWISHCVISALKHFPSMKSSFYIKYMKTCH